MANPDHLKLVRAGKDAVAKWQSDSRNEDVLDLREAGLAGAELIGADLSGADLGGADLTGADVSHTDLSGGNLSDANLNNVCLRNANLSNADLSNADLSGGNFSEVKLSNAKLRSANLGNAYLSGANLRSADLSGADLRFACLSYTNLHDANLRSADLRSADLRHTDLCDTDLRDANLSNADLRGAKLIDANLTGANLTNANLIDANLTGADFIDANFGDARVGWTVFGAVDLSDVKGLDALNHNGPSVVGVDTLRLCGCTLPATFLRGCGMEPWEVENARLFDPSLTAPEFTELQYKVFDAKYKAIHLGGVFISYSRTDAEFAIELRRKLMDDNASVWLDQHDALAGDLQKQVSRAIRRQDIVLLILSEASIASDWVEHELEMARNKEREEARDVLCPLALDGTWRAKVESAPLWRQLKKKNILDFSGWQTPAINEPYRKLRDGLRLNYERRVAPDQRPLV